MSAINIRQDKQTNKSQLTKLYEIFRETMENGFYGSIEVKFESGRVTIIKKTESMKI